MANAAGGKGTGLAPNIASLLCYICMPVTSIVFMLMEKENKDVQFHAWQGTIFGVGIWVVFLALMLVSKILGSLLGFISVLMSFVLFGVWIVFIILWVICLVKAYQGERWKIPYVGDIAEKKAGLAA